jgi:hypothetical protein
MITNLRGLERHFKETPEWKTPPVHYDVDSSKAVELETLIRKSNYGS